MTWKSRASSMRMTEIPSLMMAMMMRMMTLRCQRPWRNKASLAPLRWSQWRCKKSTGPDSMVTAAVAVIRPRTLHLLQPDFAAGTCLEGTVCDNLKNIQRWLNVTKLYGPIFAVVARWLYGFGGGNGWPL